MNAIDFSNKTVLVIGGSSGIGNGIARSFRDHGAQVFVSGTRANAADYADEEGSELDGLHYFQWDVSSDSNVEALQSPFDSLDVLVASQGIVEYKRAEFQMPTFRRVLDVNLMSVMSSCTKFHPMLAKTQGSVIVLGSGASFFSVLGNPAYSASKGALVTLTKTLAEAWAGDGIRVNGDCSRVDCHQDHQGHLGPSASLSGFAGLHSHETLGDAGGHGGDCVVSGLAASVVSHRPDVDR